jgi:hypothetical protein
MEREATTTRDRALTVERVSLGALVAWMVGLIAIYWPALRYPVFVSDSNIDASFFGYAGELVRRGGVPYLSFWDHKPPLIFYIDAAALTVSGGRVWGLWAASLATVLAAMLLAYQALRRAFGTAPALLGLTVFVAALSRVLPLNMTELYVLPLEWGTVLVVVAAATSARLIGRPFATGAAIGVLGALSFFLRANFIGAAVSASLVLTVVLLRDGRFGAWARLVGGALLGAVIASAIVIAPLARAGALAAFWDQAFHYNFLYASAPMGLRLRAGTFMVLEGATYSSVVLPIAGWVAAAAVAWKNRRRSVQLLAIPLFGIVWAPIELALASTSGRAYGHYFVVAMPALAYLTALAAWALVTRLATFGPPNAQWARRVVAVVAVAIAMPTIVGTALRLRDRPSPQLRYGQVAATSALIRSRTAPDAKLLVWGHAADLYMMADRPPASRFVYPLAMLTPRYATPALVQGFLGEVRASAPPLIIDATSGRAADESLVPSLATWNPGWRYPTTAGRSVRWWSMTPALREFYDYVRGQYRLAGYVGPLHWAVYERLPTTTAQR